MSEQAGGANSPATVTVVLTPGRSGSSLVTEMLGRLGVGLSGEMIPGRSENVRGFFEDSRIVGVHQELLQALGVARSYHPLPEGWLDTKAARDARRQLVEIVHEETAGEKQWGFKDPRTTVLLPLWEQVFNRAGVVPRYVFAFRHPGAVTASLRRGLNRDERLTELQWLYRTVEALHHTAASGFFVHYEDWFSRPREVVRGLARWCGLEDPGEEAVEQMIAEVVQEDLNRAGWQEQEIHHPLVERLYGVLRDCNGDRVHRERLLTEVTESRRLIDGFRAWANLGPAGAGGSKGKAKQADSAEESAAAGAEHSEARQASEAEIKARREQVAEMHRQLREIKRLEEENRELRVRQQSRGQQQPNRNPGGGQQQGSRNQGGGQQQGSRQVRSGPTAAALYSSVRYRVGDALVSAFASPGRDTLKLPVQLYRLFREGLARRRGQKVPAGGSAGRNASTRYTTKAIRNSVRFRVGGILVNAVAAPGRNTLAMPGRLYRLYREGRHRRRIRQGKGT